MRLQTGFRPEPLFHRQSFLHAAQIQRTPGTAATCIAQVSIPHRAATAGARADIIDAPGDSEAAPATPWIFFLRIIVHFCLHCYLLSIYSCSTFGGCMAAGDRSRVWLVVAPLLITLVLSLAVNAGFHDQIPHSLQPNDWANLTHTAERVLHSENTRYSIVYALLLVHAMQTLFCFPLMHVTKMLYGYLLGAFAGCALATAWQMALVALFLLACVRLNGTAVPRAAPESPRLRELLTYCTEMRGSKQFYLFVMCVQVACRDTHWRPWKSEKLATPRPALAFAGTRIFLAARRLAQAQRCRM